MPKQVKWPDSQVPRECRAGCAQQAESLFSRSELVELIAVWRLIGQVGSLARPLRLIARRAPPLASDYSEFWLRMSAPDTMVFVVLNGVFETLSTDRALVANRFGLVG
jgi:hypothetical protein